MYLDILFEHTFKEELKITFSYLPLYLFIMFAICLRGSYYNFSNYSIFDIVCSAQPETRRSLLLGSLSPQTPARPAKIL